MPEGDTLFRTAAALRPHLLGRVVTAARSDPRAGGAPVPASALVALAGSTVESVEAQGKHLLIRFSGGWGLRTHLGMRGSWHRYAPGERWRRPASRARLVLEVPGAVAVCFDAPTVELFEARAEPIHRVLTALGPDLLGPDWDASPEASAAEAVRRLRDPARADLPIAEALLDQRALAGIGNVYKSEVLFIERVDPFAQVRSLPDDVLLRLVATARRLLLENRGGGRRVTTSVAPGVGLDVRSRLWVYGRAGRPCLRCGTLIRVRRHGDLPRATWWCPVCQSPAPD